MNTNSVSTMKTEANFGPPSVAPAGVFTDKKVRNDCNKRLSVILSLQILVTIISAGIMYSLFLIMNLLFIASLVIAIITLFLFWLLRCARRAVPFNYILLGVYTAACAVVVGILYCQYYWEGILIALIVTAIVVISITLLSTTSWFDITNSGLLLDILYSIYVILCLVSLILMALKWVWIMPCLVILSTIRAFILTLYLLDRIQLTIGGKKYEMNPLDYIYATVLLYTYVIVIFYDIHVIVSQSN